MCLDGKYFTVCDDEPCLKLEEHGFYRLVVVADVVFLQLVDILIVDSGNDGLNRHGVDDHLKMVLRPEEFVVLLYLYEVPAFCIVRDVQVDEDWLFEPSAVKSVVSGDEAYFLLVEDELEIPVAATSCRCVEVARRGGKLLNERADGGRVGWPTIGSIGTATMWPHTILVMAVMVVVMDNIICRRRWRAYVGVAALCLNGGGGGMRGRQRLGGLQGRWCACVDGSNSLCR